MDNIQNTYGLFDAPVRITEKERIALSAKDIEQQLNAGAFLLSREEAISLGFINPQDEQDAVIVDIERNKK